MRQVYTRPTSASDFFIFKMCSKNWRGDLFRKLPINDVTSTKIWSSSPKNFVQRKFEFSKFYNFSIAQNFTFLWCVFQNEKWKYYKMNAISDQKTLVTLRTYRTNFIEFFMPLIKFFTFIIYVIYWNYWFHTKNLEKFFLLKSCFLPIKSHKTWKKAIKKFPSVTRRRRRRW
jgi:hypothetical protein